MFFLFFKASRTDCLKLPSAVGQVPPLHPHPLDKGLELAQVGVCVLELHSCRSLSQAPSFKKDESTGVTLLA